MFLAKTEELLIVDLWNITISQTENRMIILSSVFVAILPDFWENSAVAGAERLLGSYCFGLASQCAEQGNSV
jgi:hypothetical protein